MFNAVIAKVFGTANERAIKKLIPLVEQINASTTLASSSTT